VFDLIQAERILMMST